MEQKSFERIVVEGDELVAAFASSNDPMCLDFSTGKVVPASECPPEQLGEGRPAWQRGKRYICIPALDEASQEIKARFDNWEFGDAAEQEPQEPTMQAAREAPEYKDFCDNLHGDLAREETAMRWIVSLKPNVMVGWHEGDLGVTRVYDPAVREWVDAY